jgi:hypothetical protein
MVDFSSLWGGKKKPAPKAAAKPKPASRPELIQAALALHKVRGAELRTGLRNAVKALEDRNTLRNPEELERLLALVQAHRAMRRLFSNDLRRYLVLAGIRQWTGREPTSPSRAPGPSKSRTTVVRR